MKPFAAQFANLKRHPATSRRNGELRPASLSGSSDDVGPEIPGGRPGTAAFTLLELLIAVAVFAVVLLSINVVFYSALRLRNKTAEALDRAAPLQRALSLMKMDIANIVAPGGTLCGTLQSPMMGTSTGSQSSSATASGQPTTPGIGSLTALQLPDAVESSPFFYTTTGAVDDNLPWPEIQQVSYVLVQSTNATPGKDLVRCVTRNLLPSDTPDLPSQQRLISGIETFAFFYYDGFQWQTFWDSTQMTNALPLAIKVTIQPVSAETPQTQTLPPPIELVVPISVQTWTNQTSQTNDTTSTGS